MITRNELTDLSTRLVMLEQELHRAGLHMTARKVNVAVQRIGWEFAEQIERETRAAPAGDGGSHE